MYDPQREFQLEEKKILVVDADRENSRLIEKHLRFYGFKHFKLAHLSEEGANLVQTFKPDLIISDFMMPKIKGFAFIEALRKKNIDTPVIVQMAVTNPEHQAIAWESGANDIVTKPIHSMELFSRISVQLKKQFYIDQLNDYKNLAQQELDLAKGLQYSLLPTKGEIKKYEGVYGFKMRYLFQPSRFLSGDLWGVLEIDPKRFGVWICDFCGKGVKAALETFRIHTLLNDVDKDMSLNPEKVLSFLNEKLLKFRSLSTMLYGVIDIDSRTFSYASASATHPLIYSRDTHEWIFGRSDGFILGSKSGATYERRMLKIPQNSSLVLYSDLLWESDELKDILLDPDHTNEVIKNLGERTLVEKVEDVIQTESQKTFSDDLTLIEISL